MSEDRTSLPTSLPAPVSEDSGMFPSWLAPQDVTEFTRSHMSTRQPCARPGAAASAVPLFDWHTLDGVLGAEGPIDVLTVAGGQLVDVPAPRSLAAARDLMARGVSVVVRASERHDPGLARLARSFGALPGEVHVQLYATPGGTNSYGWHYDFEDVFIAQTLGAKDYYFRDNTVAQQTVLGDELDFTVFRQERSPLYSSRLLAGDWLYIPARWWHFVKGIETSLSISVGVMPPEAFRRARRIPAGWQGMSPG